MHNVSAGDRDRASRGPAAPLQSANTMMAQCWPDRSESKVWRQVRKQVRNGLRNSFMTLRRMPGLMQLRVLTVKFADRHDAAGGNPFVEHPVEIRVQNGVVVVIRHCLLRMRLTRHQFHFVLKNNSNITTHNEVGPKFDKLCRRMGNIDQPFQAHWGLQERRAGALLKSGFLAARKVTKLFSERNNEHVDPCRIATRGGQPTLCEAGSAFHNHVGR
jgi:hypothetical protein